ncbi:MAG: hypothetical protein KTR14_11535, partial [Vampirovibrio sp.]|nr:hypothetical protein [Vampirovibrio sp.]
MTIRQSNSGTPTPISKQSFQFVAKNQANKAAATENNGFVKGYDVSRFSQMPSSGQATPGAQLLRQGALNSP